LIKTKLVLQSYSFGNEMTLLINKSHNKLESKILRSQLVAGCCRNYV